RRQPHLAHFGQPLLVRPWRDTDKMQQRLVLRRRPRRRGPRRHRLDALALARQHQTGAIIAQRPSPVNVTNYAHKPLDIRRKPRFAISVVLEIHLALQAPNSESLQLFDSQPQGPRPCDSVRLGFPALSAKYNRGKRRLKARAATQQCVPRAQKKKITGGHIMSAAGIDSGFDLAATRGGPDEISRRLESLPASSYLWRLVILLSLGGWFEVYDLFFTGYIAPGLNRSGLLTTTTQAFFGFSGIGAFVAATFAGLFVGTFFLSFLADRFGRRSIFTYALLGYTAASVMMACQATSEGVLLWRFIAGIGIGVEIITIDAYITELVPSWMRGRAFAVNQAAMFPAVPVVAALSWWLVPLSPYEVDGWRWVVLIGAAGSMVIWILRLFVPESPLWLARNGRTEEAAKILRTLEGSAGSAITRPSKMPDALPARAAAKAGYAALFRPPYLSFVVLFM